MIQKWQEREYVLQETNEFIVFNYAVLLVDVYDFIKYMLMCWKIQNKWSSLKNSKKREKNASLLFVFVNMSTHIMNNVVHNTI